MKQSPLGLQPKGAVFPAALVGYYFAGGLNGRNNIVLDGGTEKIRRGESTIVRVDWGDSRCGYSSGALREDSFVVEFSVAHSSKPVDAEDLRIAEISGERSPLKINGRKTRIGETTSFSISANNNQTCGLYRIKITAEDNTGRIIPRFIRIQVTENAEGREA